MSEKDCTAIVSVMESRFKNYSWTHVHLGYNPFYGHPVYYQCILKTYLIC